MPSFTPKKYQQAALDSMECYFRNCQRLGNADYAFQESTEKLWGLKSSFTPLTGFDKTMPYFCLRIPTGGGKTYLGAKAVSLVNNRLLHTEHSVILWLVPSKAIRDQTLDALSNLDHPYHEALREAGPVTVMDLDGAKALNRSTLESSTVVIVATRQAFQVGNEDIRKVYESSGTLMPLFDDLTPAQKENLLPDDDGNIPFSLANALRLRRPFIIVDEAHNSRTELAFETLAKFHPSGIMELTATPDTQKTPSNVLHTVSAVELKVEEMIKLPIQLECVPDAEKCLGYAIDQRNQLEALAGPEIADGAPYLRPLVLIQAEANSSTKETRNTEWVKQQLVQNHKISETEIAVATGSERGLEKLQEEYAGGIFSPECPVKFIITQKALAEGWDCAYAYILVSMAELRSSTAVEQLLGRILRQPNAKCFGAEELNRSYAYVVSRDFNATAHSLRDRLIEGAGFEKHEANQFVAAARQQDLPLSTGRPQPQPVAKSSPLNETPDLGALPQPLQDKISYDEETRQIAFKQAPSDKEMLQLDGCVVMTDSQDIIRNTGKQAQAREKDFRLQPDDSAVIPVPQLVVWVNDQLRLFDETEALDYPWELPAHEAQPDEETLKSIERADGSTAGAFIDVNDEGAVTTTFQDNLQRDLNLSYTPDNWNAARLKAWFCSQIHDPSITHQSKLAFISKWLDQLLEPDAEPSLNLAIVNRHKFLIRTLLEGEITKLRKDAGSQAYDQFLFDVQNRENVRLDSRYTYDFTAHSYAPKRPYQLKTGGYNFQKHFYEAIGDFDSSEEHACAEYIDQLAVKGRIKHWVRNLEGNVLGAYSLPMASGKFYPDFVCQLPNDRILIVEYKGAHLWEGAKDKRRIGDLWAEVSNGKCLFLMIKDQNWHEIDAVIDNA